MKVKVITSSDLTTKNYHSSFNIYRKGTLLQIQCIPNQNYNYKLNKLNIKLKNYTKNIDSNKIVYIILL